MRQMSAVDRVHAAIQLSVPDRVPVDLHNFQSAAAATGLPLREVLQDGALLAQALLDAWREFGHDMILLENGTACSAQACGVEVAYRDDAAPAAHRPILDRLSDVDGLTIPDPETAFPMNQVLKAARILVRETRGQAWICARADQGPLSLASELIGMETLLTEMATGENTRDVFRLLEFCRQVATRYAFALLATGAHSTSIGEAVAGPDVISPAMYRRYAWPFEKQMADDLRSAGLIVHGHICGDATRILDDMVATGCQVLELDHKTALEPAKRAARGRACLLGNVDTTLLMSGTPGDVDDACREVIEAWKPDGGFILGPGCAVGTFTPADNLHALVDAATRYGRYA